MIWPWVPNFVSLKVKINSTLFVYSLQSWIWNIYDESVFLVFVNVVARPVNVKVDIRTIDAFY